MGWVTDKGGSGVQKFKEGGKVKKADKKALTKRKSRASSYDKYEKGGKVSDKKKKKTKKIGTAKLPKGAVLGKPETFPKYEEIKKPILPKKGDKPKVVPMSKK
mgnify:CR=1 FL=1|tara:strand:- start:490 stop:798 length:309 start_codon:yes stop_codon:yes gene_type:complete